MQLLGGSALLGFGSDDGHGIAESVRLNDGPFAFRAILKEEIEAVGDFESAGVFQEDEANTALLR